jgi:NAD+ diphosphatase
MTEARRATSSWNFLAGPYIDRRAAAREHELWWEEARGDPRTRYVLARGTAQLVIGEPQPGVAFLGGEHPLVRRAARESMLLLGWYRETRCVLVEVDEADAPADRNPAELTGLAGARFEELRPLAPLLEETEASLLAYARALSFWRVRHRFCGVCGSRNLPIRAGHVMHCTNAACGTDVFPRAGPRGAIRRSRVSSSRARASRTRWRARRSRKPASSCSSPATTPRSPGRSPRR